MRMGAGQRQGGATSLGAVDDLSVTMFFLLPEDASAWLDREARTRRLRVVRHPSVGRRRFAAMIGESEEEAILVRPDEAGAVLIDLPEVAGVELLAGTIGFKANVSFPAAAAL